MEQLEEKYIDLILNRCLNFNNSNSLMIHCDLKVHLPFAEKIKRKAMSMGINDVYINLNDVDEVHDYLANTSLEDIKILPLNDRSKWEEYAKKGGSLLFLNSVVPEVMKDIPPEKLSKLTKLRLETTPYYKENVSNYVFPWCIADLPNKRWAKSIFGETEDAYEKLYNYIMQMCMVDQEDPIHAWNEFIKKSNEYKNKLNALQIKKLRYRNSLGTDLTVSIPPNNQWLNLDKTDTKGGQMICNMPSYEIFTSPDCRYTNGIVYASRPLIYQGNIIDKFYFVFENGKVVDYGALQGKELIEEILHISPNSDYLGEVALVPYDSPISNTGLVFNETLFDENASCHLALGRGFAKSFADHEKLSPEELQARGLNQSKVHLDFMIGTPDLNIEAETNEGKKLIFKNGNYNI